MTNNQAIGILAIVVETARGKCLVTDEDILDAFNMAINALQAPEMHEERTETHGVCLDTISRQAAIEAHYEYCNKHPDAGFPVWSLKILEDLPSAQPEIIRCKECANADENYHCDYMTTWNYGDCFCSYGKRRTDE